MCVCAGLTVNPTMAASVPQNGAMFMYQTDAAEFIYVPCCKSSGVTQLPTYYEYCITGFRGLKRLPGRSLWLFSSFLKVQVVPR